jgi:hypothetical protein
VFLPLLIASPAKRAITGKIVESSVAGSPDVKASTTAGSDSTGTSDKKLKASPMGTTTPSTDNKIGGVEIAGIAGGSLVVLGAAAYFLFLRSTDYA